MTSVPLNLVRNAVTSALHPAHFFVGLDAALEWQHEAHEEISWEIFRGRLLDASQTRLRQSFEAWNLFWGDAAGRSVQPILAVKLDVANRMLHIVRSIHCYAWEGYHAGDNVYASREVRKWLRELVGSIHLDRVGSVSNLQEELRCLLFQAVVGSSRLPITSIEAPLPAFSLGELAYFGRMEAEELPAESGPMRSHDQLIDRVLTQSLSETETARLLETVLRSIPDQEVRFGPPPSFESAGVSLDLRAHIWRRSAAGSSTRLPCRRIRGLSTTCCTSWQCRQRKAYRHEKRRQTF